MLSILEMQAFGCRGLTALGKDQDFIGLLDLICKWKVIVRYHHALVLSTALG